MECHFYSSVGLCKYGNLCAKQHVDIASPARFVVIPNASPLTRQVQLNGTLIRQTMTETMQMAQECGRVLDFAIAINRNHLYGTVYLEFATTQAALEFKLGFPREFGGNNVEVRFLDIESIKQLLCEQTKCNDYFCEKVHERFFERSDICGHEKQLV